MQVLPAAEPRVPPKRVAILDVRPKASQSSRRAQNAVSKLNRVRCPHPMQEVARQHDLYKRHLGSGQRFGSLISHRYQRAVRRRSVIGLEGTSQCTAAVVCSSYKIEHHNIRLLNNFAGESAVLGW